MAYIKARNNKSAFYGKVRLQDEEPENRYPKYTCPPGPDVQNSCGHITPYTKILDTQLYYLYVYYII